MPTRLTVTIDANGVKDGETRRAEVVQAAEALARVAWLWYRRIQRQAR